MSSTLLNGPLEVGLRLLILLDAEYPLSRSIDELLVLDHVAVHTADFGGPESLHPAFPLRSADVGARRDSIRHGLELLIHRGLVRTQLSAEGISFSAGEVTHGLVPLLESPYAAALRDRVAWVSAAQLMDSPDAVRGLLASIVTSWPEQSSRELQA